jgi:hypothetical protein
VSSSTTPVALQLAGASIDSYYLGGYSPADVQPPGRLTVTRMSAAKANGDLIGAFTMKVPAGADPSAFGFLYVFGPLSASGGLMMHSVSSCRSKLAVRRHVLLIEWACVHHPL